MLYSKLFTTAIKFPQPRVTKPDFYIHETLAVTVCKHFRLVYEKAKAFNKCVFENMLKMSCLKFYLGCVTNCMSKDTLSDMTGVSSHMCRDKGEK